MLLDLLGFKFCTICLPTEGLHITTTVELVLTIDVAWLVHCGLSVGSLFSFPLRVRLAQSTVISIQNGAVF